MPRPWIPCILAAAVLMSGCGSDPPELTVALLPILDSLPGYWASAHGHFDESGVDVEIIPVNSALDRDQMMQAGEADCMLAELSATALFNAEEARLTTIGVSRISGAGAPLFSIIAGSGSGIADPEGLKGRAVAVGENTITEYIAYRTLLASGFAEEDLRFRSVPVIPERFALLMAGRVDAAILPDPLASAAIAAGHRLIADDTAIPGLSLSVLTASSAAIEEDPERIEAFLAAWYRAAEEINADPEGALEFYMRTLPAPEGLDAYFAIPRFPPPGVPDEAAWDDMTEWLEDKGLTVGGASFGDSVTAEFLPAAP